MVQKRHHRRPRRRHLRRHILPLRRSAPTSTLGGLQHRAPDFPAAEQVRLSGQWLYDEGDEEWQGF